MQPLSILYVEDNDYLRENIGLLLEAEDRAVITCATGEAALEACAARRFDLVVTDVSLPGLSGTDLTRRLVAADPAQWVVLCSGYAFGPEVRMLGSRVRALSKPFEFDDMDALIDEVSRSRRGTNGIGTAPSHDGAGALESVGPVGSAAAAASTESSDRSAREEGANRPSP